MAIATNKAKQKYRQHPKSHSTYVSLLVSNLGVVQEGVRVVDTPSCRLSLPCPLKSVFMPPGPEGQLRDVVDMDHGHVVKPLHPVIQTHPVASRSFINGQSGECCGLPDLPTSAEV